MYKNFIEYQRQYFEHLFDTTVMDYGYFTQSADAEYINGNSIIIHTETEDVISSVCGLLACGIHTTKIQLPQSLVEFGDEQDCLYLVKYQHQNQRLNSAVTIELVDDNNYQQYIEISNKLQTQEYGSLYKTNENANYLQQDKYQMYIIKFLDVPVGEFCYIPQMQAVESLIIDQQYKHQGIGTAVLELITGEVQFVYLSADNSSIAFYQKINSQIIDSYPVNNLYGSSYGLLMYINYVYDY